MDSQNTSEKLPVGVIGAGVFGTAVANLLAENRDVILYSRRQEVADNILVKRMNRGQKINERIKPTSSIEELTSSCTLIFPVVSSSSFREMIKTFSPFLRPDHILIHGTKGLDVRLKEGETLTEKTFLNRKMVRTMSEIILQETEVMRVGCLAGPNLASEIALGQPAATVLASRFDEVIVIREGQRALRSSRFQVFGNHDITGVELAGVLKNVIAIAAGALSGLGYGENARALLISRGMVEMVHIGKLMGGEPKAFFGLAGVGDLIATSSSEKSRNFTVGYRLAQGEKIENILLSMNEVAEGVNTVRVTNAFIHSAKTRAPMTETIYKCVFKNMPVKEGVDYLMNLPLGTDVDYFN
jgi:glycerol-3-phosphate dehydrogenase (NAD(P)+)